MASPQAPASGRRRQRSTRLTVAVALLVVAALLVVGAIASGSLVLVAIAAAVSVLLGAAATRITHAELLAARLAAARDRAEQAQSYRAIADARTAENLEFASTMRDRLHRHEEAIVELENALTDARGRAAEAERQGAAVGERLAVSEQRAAEAVIRVAELEQELDVVRAELAVVTRAWNEAEAGLRKRA